MHPKRFALIAGILMLVMGVVALIPNMVGPVDGLPLLNLNTSYGMFMNLIPMNVLNKVALVLFGVAGIYCSSERFTNLPASINWSRTVFFVMGVLAILGLIPQTNTLFGYWPLFGNDVLAHAVFAVFGAYFGYRLTSKVPTQAPRVKPTFSNAGIR